MLHFIKKASKANLFIDYIFVSTRFYRDVSIGPAWFFNIFLCCRDYIQRAFQACATEADKDTTEAFLKTTLNDRMKDGSAFTIDWEKEPLPM